MKVRVITGIIFSVIIIPLILLAGTPIGPFGAPIGLLLFEFLGIASVYELLSVTGFRKKPVVAVPIYFAALALPILLFFKETGPDFFKYCAILFFLIAFYLLMVSVFSKGRLKLPDIAILFTMSMYVLISFNSIYMLRLHIPGQGKYAYLVPFAVAWLTDVFAYFTGCAFGKHKLIPEVSPKKTVEGAIGGFVFGIISVVVFGFVVGCISDQFTPNYPALILAGALMSLFSMGGDLIASLVKRHYGVKDYGWLLPGHGGILDRFDSVLASAPILIMLYDLKIGFALFEHV